MNICVHVCVCETIVSLLCLVCAPVLRLCVCTWVCVRLSVYNSDVGIKAGLKFHLHHFCVTLGQLLHLSESHFFI